MCCTEKLISMYTFTWVPRQSASNINLQACRVSNRLQTTRIPAIRSTIHPHLPDGGRATRFRQFVTSALTAFCCAFREQYKTQRCELRAFLLMKYLLMYRCPMIFVICKITDIVKFNFLNQFIRTMHYNIYLHMVCLVFVI